MRARLAATLMATTSSWLTWALLSALFAALTAVLAKVGLRGVDSDLATLLRTIVIVAMLVPFVWVTGKWVNPASLSGKSLLFIVLSAVATGLSWVCYFRALQIGDASRVAPVDKLSIALVVGMAFVFLGERPAAKDWAGVVLVTSGVLLLALRK